MQPQKIRKTLHTWMVLILWTLTALTSCRKYVEVDPPENKVTGANVFKDDATATAVLSGLYIRLSEAQIGSGSPSALYFYAGLSSDELTLWNGTGDSRLIAYYINNLTATSGESYGSELWQYLPIYICNSAIEQLEASNALTPAVKQQLLGEAKFMRAFNYFYLASLFGDVPLVLSTPYRENALLPRTPKDQVFAQMISDLKDAQELLSEDYLSVDLTTLTAEKTRPTKWAAAALLARVYLSTGNWAEAENEASFVIGNTNFSLAPLNEVFLKNSAEAIWQLQPVNSGWNTEVAKTLVVPATGPYDAVPAYLNDQLLNAFENGDQRRITGNWIDSVNVDGTPYLYAAKYKINEENTDINSGTGTDNMNEYLMVLRLAEQYLIRAEARARQGKLQEAMDDVNTIRLQHGGLPDPLPVAASETDVVNTITHEHQVEMFTEWGDRWLTLKRTGDIDHVMEAVAPLKGGTWSPYKALFPLPLEEIQKDQNLTQNTGY
jgi:starch-binding outer membrane protein, SusD/RagB family